MSRNLKRSTKYLSNSNIELPEDVQIHSDLRDEQILKITKILCPHLIDEEAQKEDSDITRFTVKPLSGGLSNVLFVVSRVDLPSSSVLLRIHPQEDENGGIVDRDVENHLAAWLSEKEFAPIYYGRFQNGRIEEFYETVLPLHCSDMPKYAPKIAQNMATLHGMTPHNVIPKPSVHEASIYESIDNWLQKATHLEEDKSENMDFLKQLEQEWKWLFSELQSFNVITADPIQVRALEFIRQVVLAHMDCQSLNILKDTSSDEIKVIDFEYAGWNPRAADIANTFCEYCDMNNIQADFENEYPSCQQQDDYLIPYMRQANAKLANELDETEQWEPFLAAVRQEIGRFSLVSHLGWAVWSVIKSNEEESGIDFDYIKYAHHRMDGYQFSKNKYFLKN